jgi:predicted nuclease of restriction endonuclease-like (RecB) superfamily
MKLETQFVEVIQLITKARSTAYQAVNTEMINLYWNIGEYISKRVEVQAWGKSVVAQLAKYIEKQSPDLKGYSDKNLWRMKQFYETYKDYPKLSTLLREINWTNNLLILSTRSYEEKEFYLRLCIQERYTKRELERQIDSSLFERTMMSKTILSPLVRELGSDLTYSFKDSCVFEFLGNTILPTLVGRINLPPLRLSSAAV